MCARKLQMWASRVWRTVVLLLGLLLAAAITVSLLVAAGIWCLVIAMMLREMLGSVFNVRT